MSTSSPPLALTSQITLVTSLIAYPLLFFLVTPRDATPPRFAKSREAISAVHCTLVTLASIYELRRRYSEWNTHTPSSFPTKPATGPAEATSGTWLGSGADGARSALIRTRSTVGNSITALETAYLVQDAVILILGARLRARYGGGRGKSLAKEINWRVLGWHHAGLSSALGLLQWYIARGREKGILIVLMLMLMNASTPVGTLHWYLVNFQPSRRQAILVVNAAYLLTYGVCRVYLVHWILQVYGSQTGQSAIGAFSGLRTSCRLGTATIGIANSVWLILGIRKFIGRYLSSARPRKGIRYTR